KDLRGDELILVDAQRGSVIDVRRLTSLLVRHSAAALAFAPPTGKGVPRSLAIACKRQGLPLIEIPQSVICQRIADVAASLRNPGDNEDESPQRIKHQQSQAITHNARGDIHSALSQVERDCGGARIWLVTGGGVLHASTQPPPVEEDVNLVVRSALQSRGIFEVRLSTGTTGRVCPLDVPGRPGRNAGYLVCELPNEGLSTHLNALIEHAIMLLETQFEFLYTLRDVRRPSEVEFISRIDAGQGNSEDLEAWSRALGFKPETNLLCILARAASSHSSALEHAEHCIRDLADSFQITHIAAVAEQEVRAFLFLEDHTAEERQKNLDAGYRLLHFRLTQMGITPGRCSAVAHGAGDFLQVLLDARRVCVLDYLRSDAGNSASVEMQSERSLSTMLLAKNT